MRAGRDVHVRVPSPSLRPALRRSVMLALATFAALLTLVLPAPAMARPVSPTSGSVAATGGAAATSVTHSGRRTHRGEQARSGRSVAGSTGGAVAWSLTQVSAAVAGSSGSGPTLAAALPPSASTAILARTLARSPQDAGAVPLALVGARSSRAPPTL